MPKTRDKVNPSLNNIVRRLEREVPGKAFNFFRRITPKDTGNARRRTRLVGKSTIRAAYDYASFLDKGHSRQAKSGMSRPTTAYITRLVKQIVRK